MGGRQPALMRHQLKVGVLSTLVLLGSRKLPLQTSSEVKWEQLTDNTEKTEEQELVEDLIQIITVFSCRLQGKRANKAKKLLRELKNND